MAILTLAGCGVSYDALSNPNEFGFEADNGTLRGAYNPIGFAQSEVTEQLRDTCEDQQLASYSERPASDGLIAFTATCLVTDFFGGDFLAYRVTRLPSGIVSVTSTTAGFGFP